MLATVLIAANMCLQDGELVDVSRYVDPAASFLELKATLEHATGTLVVYSPGYEEQRARFTDLRINPMQISDMNAASSLLSEVAGPKASKGVGRS
jgi:hypothetical protein